MEIHIVLVSLKQWIEIHKYGSWKSGKFEKNSVCLCRVYMS
jgi:hypothetical protein